ncbi:hypothetical protein JSY14_08055 [Brachybacterium sp. EF45031]|uniref:YciI family protein n=1 Tax=Brachybacterium sillae TaxID=2810536 RepID=UPI00217D2502|nr:YciI family protein [Brachybacterium sillae]MCS6711973.1 hypothetical protein [Brachybacterium sillae]
MDLVAVQYLYADAADRLAQHRPEHRAFLGGLLERGVLVASGPLGDPAGALILVRADGAEEALQLLDDDPFRREGLIVERTARPWTVVLGSVG